MSLYFTYLHTLFNVVIMAITTPNDIGGYIYEVVDSLPDRLLCKICHLPSRDPYLSVCCGHLFCKSCLDNAKKASAITNACPVCRDEEFTTFPNKAVDREIKSLHIYCTNKVIGCEWQGELNDINNHLGKSDGCQFEGVKCYNECGKMIKRQHLAIHVENKCPRRKANCLYCYYTGEHQFIEGQPKEECPKLPLPCPNKCEVGSVPREDMEAHRKKCPLEMIQCDYYGVGCETKMARKDHEKHKKENMEDHLMKTECKLTITTDQLAIALQRISTLEALMYLTIDKPIIDKPVNRTLHSAAAIESSLGWSAKLAARVMMSKSDYQVCPVILKMSDFNKLKKDNVAWCSDPFYTDVKGYKMCIKAYPAGNGAGKDSHLSFYLCLMEGPHDDSLSWPMQCNFQIKLLNQVSDSQHLAVSVFFDESSSEDSASRVTEGTMVAKGRGRSQFISNKDINNVTSPRQFLKDNCLFFQIYKF